MHQRHLPPHTLLTPRLLWSSKFADGSTQLAETVAITGPKPAQAASILFLATALSPAHDGTSGCLSRRVGHVFALVALAKRIARRISWPQGRKLDADTS